MARQTNGSNQSLQSAASINLSGENHISVVFWIYVDSYEDNYHIALELTADGLANNGGFVIGPDWATGGGIMEIGAKSSTGDLNYADFPRPGAAGWHHVIAEFDLADSTTIYCYIDGTVQTPSVMNSTPSAGTFANSTLNLMSRNNSSLWLAGRMAELAIYSGALSSGDRSDLQTKAPAIVGSPLFYWPLCGTASPEPNQDGGVDMTVNGATFVADPATLTGSVCGGGGGGGGNPWYYYAQQRERVKRTWNKAGLIWTPDYQFAKAG